MIFELLSTGRNLTILLKGRSISIREKFKNATGDRIELRKKSRQNPRPTRGTLGMDKAAETKL